MGRNTIIRYIAAIQRLESRERSRATRRRLRRLQEDLDWLLEAQSLIAEEDALIAAGSRPPLPRQLLRNPANSSTTC